MSIYLVVVNDNLDFGMYVTIYALFAGRLEKDAARNRVVRRQTLELDLLKETVISSRIFRHVNAKTPIPSDLVDLPHCLQVADYIRIEAV